MKLLETTAAAETGSAQRLDETDRNVYRSVQVSLPAGGSVELQGRVLPGLPWAVLHTFAASGVEPIFIPREVRAVLSGSDGIATVVVALDA